MGLLIVLFFLIPGAALIGGIAGAIVGGGSEDRPIWVNTLIGMTGGGAASAVLAMSKDGPADDLTFGHLALALIFSIGLVLLLERRENAPPESTPVVATGRWPGIAKRVALGVALLVLFWLLSMVLVVRQGA